MKRNRFSIVIVLLWERMRPFNEGFTFLPDLNVNDEASHLKFFQLYSEHIRS